MLHQRVSGSWSRHVQSDFFSGPLCLVLFTLVPFTFQGVLGLEGMLAPSIVDGSGVAAAMAGMVGHTGFVTSLLVMMMILALMLCLMTAMAGSSRTLYQGSRDGWLPRYLSYVNLHGAPTRAMWTDLVINLAVLAIACADATSFFFILAVSNVGYIIFNFLNLNSGWIHRIDNADVPRPWRAPTWLLGLGTLFAFVNACFMGAGAKVWNPIALWAGLFTASLIVPVFIFRHYIQDKGVFPAHMLQDLGLTPGDLSRRKAGILPVRHAAGGPRGGSDFQLVFPASCLNAEDLPERRHSSPRLSHLQAEIARMWSRLTTSSKLHALD